MPGMSPFCAVWMVTYNQEKYIGEAIESVLNQKTNFPVMLYLGEDCSTDKTREICIHYAERYPDKITLLLNKENDIFKNAVSTYNACFQSGAKYVAMCEGDDYWTDLLKLQKQIDFLEVNKDFSICYHNARIIYEGGEKPSSLFLPPTQKEVSTIEDLCKINFIPTASCVFRNNLFNEFPKWFYGCAIGDWPLHLLNAEHGKIRYLNKEMSVYRIHKGGAWGGQDLIKRKKKVVKDIKTFNLYFNNKYKPFFYHRIVGLYKEIAELYIPKSFLKTLLYSFKLLINLKYNKFAITRKSIIKMPLISLKQFVSKYVFRINKNPQKNKDKVEILDTDIFIVAYPKSGSTWVRFVIGNYLMYPRLCDFNNYHHVVPDIHYNPEEIRHIKFSPVIVKSHFAYTPEYNKVIYIVRDPRDVAVSYYFHCKKFNLIDMNATFEDFIKILLGITSTPNTPLINNFGSWNEHVLSWVKNKKDNLLVLKYEDIVESPVDGFKKLLSFCNIKIQDDRLNSAIQNSTFKKLRDLEDSNQKTEKIVDILKNSNKQINFIREGKAGGYKKHFTPELEQLFMNKNREAASLFGYN